MLEAVPSTTRDLTLNDTIKAAEANNRAIQVAQQKRETLETN
jgi:hypothetical protein